MQLHLQVFQPLPRAWQRSAPDVGQALTTSSIATAARLLVRHAWRVSAVCPTRVWRRTVTRGAMVRKKASREQLAVATRLLWYNVSVQATNAPSRIAAGECSLSSLKCLLQLIGGVRVCGQRLSSSPLHTRRRLLTHLVVPVGGVLVV